MRLLKREKDALAALLERGAESPHDLAEDIVAELDRARGERDFHYAVVYTAGPAMVLGPFSTVVQASKAVHKYPAAEKFFLTHGNTAEGLERVIREVDEPAAPKGDYDDIAADAALFRKGWKGNRKDRGQYV